MMFNQSARRLVIGWLHHTANCTCRFLKDPRNGSKYYEINISNERPLRELVFFFFVCDVCCVKIAGDP